MRKSIVIALLLALFIVPGLAQAQDDSLPTIAEIVASDARFETLASVVVGSQLLDNLSSPGSYTVFAPTDDAFAALPPAVLAEVAANPSLLTRIVRYHVSMTYAPASVVVASSSIKTIEGTNISIEVTPDGVVLNGRVLVTTTDILASNGVVHIVDAVLVPDLSQSSFFGGADLLPGA